MRLLVVVVAVAACDMRQQQLEPRVGRLSIDDQVAIPSDHQLQLEIADALAKQRRAALDRALDAKEPGEQLEHASLSQIALDRGIFGSDDLFQAGDDLFAYQFRPENGLGNALAGHAGIEAGPLPPPNLRRVHQGAFGGPDAMACADCHRVGGDDGAGTATQNTYFRSDGDRTLIAEVRNPPAVMGLGPIEALATEMTEELQGQRDRCVADAVATSTSTVCSLDSKGTTFGAIRVSPTGVIDFSMLRGVSADLVVRPFGWKGHQATLRGMVKESFRVHLGLVPMSDQQRVRDGLVSPAMFGDGPWFDIDDDGVTIEVEDGMVSTMVGYLSQIEVPIVKPPDDQVLLDRFARGRAAFVTMECATCHVPELRLVDTQLVTRAEQTENTGSPPIVIDVATDGPTPKIEPIDLLGSAHVVRLFSDLRRHDMGNALSSGSDQIADGGAIPARQWLTRPLWGLADSAPYLHDGRAPTIADAILAHDGDARASAEHFANGTPDDQADLLVYLLSLQRVRRMEVP